MKVTYYGHSCFLLELDDTKILFDPFIQPNELAAHIDIKTIHPDYILQSHGHEDHMADLVQIAKQSNATVVCSWEMKQWLDKQGVSNNHPMNIGGKWNFGFGSVKMVFAAHSNSLPDGSYGGVAAGYLIDYKGKRIYYSGDTALIQDMKLIGELYPPDIAFLPVGDNFTMGIDEAIIACDFIRCKNIIPMHFDTFGFIKIDHIVSKEKFKNAGVTAYFLKVGEEKLLK